MTGLTPKLQRRRDEIQAMRDAGKTHREIGEAYSISPSRVAQILTSIHKAKLKAPEAQDGRL